MELHAYLKRVPAAIIEHCTRSAEFAKSYVLGNHPETETLELKQSWDGLHYLLSPRRRRPAKELDTIIVWDTSDPLSAGILGSKVLNRDCKFSFGAPKWIEAPQVQQIAGLLESLSWEPLADEIVSEDMARCGVYPEGLWEDEEKAARVLRFWISRLQKFYASAAAAGQVVICYLKLE